MFLALPPLTVSAVGARLKQTHILTIRFGVQRIESLLAVFEDVRYSLDSTSDQAKVGKIKIKAFNYIYLYQLWNRGRICHSPSFCIIRT